MTRAHTVPAPDPGTVDAAAARYAASPIRNVAVVPAPRLAELATAGRCFPSGPRGEPGCGDFFEVLVLDDDRSLIAVGDVAGHGPAAAARMRALRAENRALALAGLSPAETLARLDMFQVRQGIEELATLWLGIYDRATECLEYSSAGHLPPVLARGRGGARLLAETSAPPLGSGYVRTYVATDAVPFPAGALLIAYSDGLVERAGLDLEHQIETLRGIVDQIYRPKLGPEAALNKVLDLALQRLPRSPIGAPDDVCILAVHRLAAVNNDGTAPHDMAR